MQLFIQLIREEDGQDLVEYALLTAAIGLALITTVHQLTLGIVSVYNGMIGQLSGIDWTTSSH